MIIMILLILLVSSIEAMERPVLQSCALQASQVAFLDFNKLDIMYGWHLSPIFNSYYAKCYCYKDNGELRSEAAFYIKLLGFDEARARFDTFLWGKGNLRSIGVLKDQGMIYLLGKALFDLSKYNNEPKEEHIQNMPENLFKLGHELYLIQKKLTALNDRMYEQIKSYFVNYYQANKGKEEDLSPAPSFVYSVGS